MTRPRIQRVPCSYAPKYPKTLTREEYESLIEPDQKRRILSAATAAGISLGVSLAAPGTASGQQPAVPNRRQAVLDVLSKTLTSGYKEWLPRSKFARGEDKQGFPVVIPHIPISYGNSQNGVFDLERARRMAGELFTAYGLQPTLAHEIDVAGVEATLDVYDPTLQVGTKLRGPAVGSSRSGFYGSVKAEPDSTRLGDDELELLAADGQRIQVADLESYPLMDGDQVTPTIAYLASIVAFLNEVTSGPDIDLNAILDNRRVRTVMPHPERVKSVLVTTQDEYMLLACEEDAVAEFAIDPRAGYQRRVQGGPFHRDEWKPLEAELVPGGISWLELGTDYRVTMTIKQGGAQLVSVEAKGLTAFLPPRFDPMRPFSLVLEFPKGTYRIPRYLTLVGQ